MSINILQFKNDVAAKARTYHVPKMDADDVEQELWLHLLKVQSKYNPARASARTFVVRVITNKIRDLIKATNAQKRYLDYNSLSLEELQEKELNLSYE